MATKVVMEALSPTMEEGRLVEWKKKEGDAVAVGDVLAEVETDKAMMELVARAAGTLLKQVVPAGATVPVSELVALIGEKGESVNGRSAAAAAAGAGKAAAEKPQVTSRWPRSRSTRRPPPARRPPTQPRRPPQRAGARPHRPRNRPYRRRRPRADRRRPAAAGDRVKASPLARKIARGARAWTSHSVAGSGPEGRIVQRDLAGAAAAPAAGAASAAAAQGAQVPAFQPVPAGTPFADVPLTQIRKTIAQAAGPVHRPDPDLLSHRRGRHGARGRGARGAQRRSGDRARCRSTTSSSRRSRSRCGSTRRATPGGRTTTSATGTRCTSAWRWRSRTA